MFRGCTRFVRLKNISLVFLCLLFVVLNSFNVESNSNISSFAVNIAGPLDNDVIKAGGPVHFIITVKNFTGEEGYMGKQDVVFIYEISSPDGEIVYQKTDTKAVLVGENTSTPYKETFFLSDNVKQGFYTLNAKITSLDGKDSCESDVVFEVVRVGDFGRDIMLILLGVGFFIACLGFFYEHRKVSRMKVSGRDLEKYIGKKKK